MTPILGRFSAPVFALFRMVAGLLFACHGAQKLLGFPPGGPPSGHGAVFLTGASIELIGGLMIAIGLLGSLAAFICSGEMAVAYFMVHAPQSLFPIVNKGELAVLYCFVFLFIAAHGSGIWSVDGLMRKAR